MTDALTDYVRELFAPEDELLETLRDEMSRRGLPEIQISAEEGKLLQVLLNAVGARRVLEIGTLGGYSTIWMARALEPGARLLTLEIAADRAALARDFVRRAGVEALVEVREGDARELLPALADAEPPFDAIFIDADKESYPRYLDAGLRLLRPGGLLIGAMPSGAVASWSRIRRRSRRARCASSTAGSRSTPTSAAPSSPCGTASPSPSTRRLPGARAGSRTGRRRRTD